jgi:bla regulator protein blaR1
LRIRKEQPSLCSLPSSNDQIVQLRLMVQSLLADRFKLVANDTIVTRPIYTLVIAKSGSKLQETAPGNESQCSGGSGELRGHGIPMSLLVRFLSQRLGRPAVDETGLKGSYDLELKSTPNFDSPEMMQGPPTRAESAAPDSSGPSIFTAIQEQLELTIKATNGPAEALQIVRIEKPSEN